MIKGIRIKLVVILLAIFTSHLCPLADSLADNPPQDFAPEGFRPVYIDEDGKKIIFESEDEDDDTEIGIDYSVDLGEDEGGFVDFDEVEEDDSLIEVLGDLSLDEPEAKPRQSSLLILVIGIPLASAALFLILKGKYK